MLITLSPLGNLSRYIRHLDKVPVHETALLLIDGNSVCCSGAILAARSPVLEKVLKQNYEIVLDGFQDMIPQLNQCLEVLYGGAVSMTHDNVIAFLKFGITFQIDELVSPCCVWLQEKGLYQEIGLLLVHDIEKRLKLLDKLVPRVRQHSAGSAGSSLSSRSGSQEYDPPSPDPCSPDPDCSPPFSSLLSPLHLLDHPVLNEERWSKAPKLNLGSSSSSTRPKVSGDACLVPLMSKMRSDDDKEWKPNSRPLKGRIGFKSSHDENREEKGRYQIL
ncbi:uncharacterized protein LOC134815112 [Bolinopsis microptera]|uniref:uncharacterized protein LOC134815112 n=1 Tax=Bolinopsis microptera TaxID=2820187 RepID=UPI00307A0A9A